MQKIIIGKLQQIEKQENVRILHAVESGSRAWGFELMYALFMCVRMIII